MDYEQFLRDRVTALRMERGISEYQLSLELGKCKTYIQAITSGKALPSFDAFFNLCDYFELTPEEFFAMSNSDTAQYRNLKHKISQLSASDLALAEQLVNRLLSDKSGGRDR